MEDKEDSCLNDNITKKRSVSEISEYDREEEMSLTSNFGGMLPAKEEDEFNNINSSSSRKMSTITDDQIALSTESMKITINTSTNHNNIIITQINTFKVKVLSKQLSLRGLNTRSKKQYLKERLAEAINNILDKPPLLKLQR